MQVALTLPDGQTLPSVAYSITGAGGNEVTNSVVAVPGDDATVSIELSLPAGTGYTIEMAASTAEGAACADSATFDVVPSQTTAASLDLICTSDPENPDENNGPVVIEANVISEGGGTCPAIDAASVSPLVTNVGDTIALSAGVSGGTVAWSATRGSLAESASDAPLMMAKRRFEELLTSTLPVSLLPFTGDLTRTEEKRT